jgi:hypothetical protein
VSRPQIYTEKELEYKLEGLRWKITYLMRSFNVAYTSLLETRYKLNEMPVSDDIVRKLDELITELRDTVHDAIDELVAEELGVDVDVEKYSVKPSYETEHVIGVVLVKEGDELKPVIIYTDYKEVWCD